MTIYLLPFARFILYNTSKTNFTEGPKLYLEFISERLIVIRGNSHKTIAFCIVPFYAMFQTSLTAWLNKPKTVKEPPPNLIPLTTNNIKAAPPRQDDIISCPKSPRKHVPSFGKLNALPSNVTLEHLTPETLPAFKRLNALLLPIPYPQKFYDEIFSDPITAGITLMALWHSKPSTASMSSPSEPSTSKPTLVAAIRCRILPTESKPTLYISTIGILSPYRSHGLATHLLSRVLSHAIEEYDVGTVSAHVWEANAEGREWYRKRGFEEVEWEEGYYRRLKPNTAIRVERRVGVGDLLMTAREESEG
ncbi:acyl-CoA N-acyltransferase [Patellaria atrata CBS 101060]|uniref:Acyl-CoA N-acyltransferase n=1 Tax=Patellaria atrata CBS 101060 TaxID=1346257 RepID=A0A9P4VQF8_9PEZI|nr:acyl-CoA N-acyltransferase [Patellaria atrata CBS 101060]